MAYRHVIGIAVIGALAVAPLFARAEDARRSPGELRKGGSGPGNCRGGVASGR